MIEKQQALLTVARAYYDRESYVQYDQRSMDRVLELTPRRRKRLPPECANSQYTQFLDCSGFTTAVYFQAFGYELPADLTWHMVDYLEPRIYYRELTHQETPEELDAIEREVRALLQPGDLVVYDRGVGSGHIVMCIDNGCYTDCANPAGTPDSYDYVNGKNNIYDHGGIWIRSLDRLFARDTGQTPPIRTLFHSSTRRFAIARPLELLGKPTEQTQIRMNQAKDLWCAVENSAPGLRQAVPGGRVDYRVTVRNQYDPVKEITVTFAAPAGSKLLGEDKVTLTLSGGKEVCLTFTVEVDAGNTAFYLEGPSVTVNGLEVYAHRVLLGSSMSDSQLDRLKADVSAALAQGATALEAAAKAYGAQGIAMESREDCYAWTHFFLHDSTKGDVLSRRPQQPRRDLAVWSGFGGKGVITPEMGSADGMRTTYIHRRDLLPGDIILCLGGGFGRQSCSCFFDGESLTGRFAFEGEFGTITGAEMDAFIDGLFNQYAFLILRPWQAQ